jgi:peptide/nickel transport system permease protein
MMGMQWITRLPGWQPYWYVRVAWIFLFVIAFVAVFGPLIANEKPLYCQLDGSTYFPVFSGIGEATLSAAHPEHSPVQWHTTAFDAILRTPIPYSATTIDLQTGATVGPFDEQPVSTRFRHWLGTDIVGRDVLAGMIRGCRISLLIGLGAMLLAVMIGVPLGTIGAYWGNKERKISSFQLMVAMIVLTGIALICFMPVELWLRLVLFAILICLGYLLLRIPKAQRATIALPIDQWVMGLISVVDGFPGMFLILVLVAILPVKGWVIVTLVIALLRWPSMARYMRAEVFRMKETNYIKAAQLVNLPSLYIMRRHIVPYAFRPVMISFIFGVASAILAESTLSFIGIGLPPEEINWGRLLAQSRNHFDAWWLVLFPGMAIFFTLLSLYSIGNAWRKIQG